MYRIRTIIALAAVTMLAAVGVAYGAGLGPVTSSDLGAGGDVVGSCQTSTLDVSWTTAFDALIPGFEITSVTVSGIDQPACKDVEFRMQLSGPGGAALGIEKVVPNINGSISFGFGFAGEDLLVDDLEDVHIVLNGP